MRPLLQVLKAAAVASIARATPEVYDYIILGGGTAGLTIAARLTEDAKTTVLVLEAGNDHSNDLNVLAPGLATAQYGNSEYDWNFKTVPQTHANNRVIAHIRGKQLGGSSAMNFLFWTHASRGDIDDWGRLGNAGWSWKELDPFFRKSETYTPPSQEVIHDLKTEYVQPAIHGTKGSIANTFPDGHSPLGEAWPRTYDSLGLAVKSDPRDGLALGGYTNLINLKLDDHTRSYAATAYYLLASKRKNLKVITGALVDRILFSHKGSSHIATGASWTVGNQTYTATARKEVVLSAGTMGSPGILERSGIGGRAVLQKLGIDVVVDNPNVGENLQDHVYVPIGYAVNPGVPTNEDFSNATFFEEAYAEYLANHTGPLASSGASSALLSLAQIGSSAISFSPSGLPPSNPGLAAQYALLLEALRSEAVTQELTITGGISPQFSNDITKLFSTSAKGHFFSILGALEHPFSRGSVHITSQDPNTYPIIDPRYLSHPIDIELLGVIALHLQHVAKTKPLSDLLQGNGTVYQPGYHKLTTENVRDWIRQSVQSEYHPAGTCAMMSRALEGVVGPTLKVYGVKGLRVVDASIFPLLPRGNLQTLVYAVAERAAGWIRDGL